MILYFRKTEIGLKLNMTLHDNLNVGIQRLKNHDQLFMILAVRKTLQQKYANLKSSQLYMNFASIITPCVILDFSGRKRFRLRPNTLRKVTQCFRYNDIPVQVSFNTSINSDSLFSVAKNWVAAVTLSERSSLIYNCLNNNKITNLILLYYQ